MNKIERLKRIEAEAAQIREELEAELKFISFRELQIGENFGWEGQNNAGIRRMKIGSFEYAVLSNRDTFRNSKDEFKIVDYRKNRDPNRRVFKEDRFGNAL